MDSEAGPKIPPSQESLPGGDPGDEPPARALTPRWPPPGLERLQGDLRKVRGELGTGAALLVFPLLYSAIEDTGSFVSSGPFGGAWWIVVAAAVLGVYFLISAGVKLFRLLRRGARAMDQGYGLRTVALVAADDGRDTGFLLYGGRAFSVLDEGTRHGLAAARLSTAGAWFAAAAWLAVGFVLGILIAFRGGISPTGLVGFTLVPSGLLIFGGYVLRAWENGVLQKARREWHQKPWSSDLEKEEIEAWKRDSGEPAGSPSGRGVRAAAWAVILAGAFIIVPSTVLVVSSSVSPVFGLLATPRFGETAVRAGRVEVLWQFRIPVDPAVTPQEAGEIVHVLGRVGATNSYEVEREPVRTYERDFVPDGSRENPTGIVVEAWPTRLFAAMDTLGPEGVAYVRELASHPALGELSVLARADSLDTHFGRWRVPYPEDLTAASFPIPRFGLLRNVAYVAAGKAALAAFEGRDEEAERTLREVITFGLLMTRDDPALIGNLIGTVIAGIGASGLISYYESVGRGEDAEAIERGMDLGQRAAERTGASRPESSYAVMQGMPSTVLDRDALLGIRWEFFAILNTIAPCMNVNRVVFGPDGGFERWLDQAREALVHFPSQEPLFDLMSRGWLGSGEPAPQTWLGRLFSTIMGGGGPGTCARMLEDLTADGGLF